MFYLRSCLSICLLTFAASCTNDIKEVDRVINEINLQAEIARNVEILYSDSAVIKVKIISPTLRRYNHQGESYDEFPDGLLVEFLDNYKNVNSWLEADYAIRKDKDKKIYVESNVVMYNKKDDKLETEELVWDEASQEIYTNRPVKITQPISGDTSFGYGFKADQEFTRFEIKRKFSAIKNVEELTKDLDN